MILELPESELEKLITHAKKWSGHYDFANSRHVMKYLTEKMTQSIIQLQTEPSNIDKEEDLRLIDFCNACNVYILNTLGKKESRISVHADIKQIYQFLKKIGYLKS